MTEALQEDTQYLHDGTVDDFAIEDDDPTGVQADEADQTVETKLIKEIRQYLKEAKTEHNSFDIIDLTEQAKMTPTQQIAMHKCVVQHLRNIENIIKNKVKEN
jgi:hypothetical protein